MCTIPDHQGMIDYVQKIAKGDYAEGGSDAEFYAFITQNNNLSLFKAGAELADTLSDTNHIGDIVGILRLISDIGTLGLMELEWQHLINTYMRNLNSLHGFSNPGYNLMNDPSNDAVAGLLKFECGSSATDDCDSVLDPLSLDQNGGDSARYQFVGMNDPISPVGYTFKSAQFYARLLWFRYWDGYTKTATNPSQILGFIAHLAQDISAIPHHVSCTNFSGHPKFENWIKDNINWDNAVKTAITKYIKPRAGICKFIDEVEKGKNIVDIPISSVIDECAEFSKQYWSFENCSLAGEYSQVATETVPYAIAATYTILKLGHLVSIEVSKEDGFILTGDTFCVIAPNSPGWAAGNFCENVKDIWLPTDYVLDESRGNMGYIIDEVESSDVRKQVISPTKYIDPNTGKYKEGLHIEARVHGSNWWGPRGYLFVVTTLYGRKAHIHLSIDSIRYGTRSLFEFIVYNRHHKPCLPTRYDDFTVGISWDGTDIPKACFLMNGVPNESNYLVGDSLLFKKGSFNTQWPVPVGTSQSKFPYHHFLTLGLLGTDPSVHVFKRIELCLEEPSVQIRQSLQGTNLSLKDLLPEPSLLSGINLKGLICNQSDVVAVQKLDENNPHDALLIKELWDRRILVKASKFIETKPGQGTQENAKTYWEMNITYALGYIKQYIDVTAEAYAFVGYPGKSTYTKKIIEKGQVKNKSGYSSERVNYTYTPNTPTPIQGETFLFSNDDFVNDRMIEVEVTCNDRTGQSATAKHKLYAKALLCFISYVNKEVPEIKQQENNLIIKEMVSRIVDIYKKFKKPMIIKDKHKALINKYFKPQINKAMEKIRKEDEKNKFTSSTKIMRDLVYGNNYEVAKKRFDYFRANQKPLTGNDINDAVFIEMLRNGANTKIKEITNT